MTKQVKKLQRAALKDPVRISINKKNKSVDTLDQKYIFVPKLDQSTALVWLLNEYRMVLKNMKKCMKICCWLNLQYQPFFECVS